MALQGTLDTFALPDVLRLLAATKKTGRLHLDGNRGSGDVWVLTGDVVAIEVTGASTTGPVEHLFELLRYTDGAFAFQPDDTHPSPEVAVEVEPLLTQAEALLDEWRIIESVVPSLASWVTLVPELSTPNVTLDRDRWRTLAAIGAGSTVGELGNRLELGELPVSRAVKELVESGLAAIEAREDTAPAERHLETHIDTPAPLAGALLDAADDAGRWSDESLRGTLREPKPLGFSAFDDPVDEAPGWAEDDEPTTDAPASVAPLVSSVEDYAAAFPGLHRGEASDDDNDLDADEVARQLANLSPKAAKAVRAAAQATTDAEREAALADVPDDEDEPLNRGLLLKFLSSVKS